MLALNTNFFLVGYCIWFKSSKHKTENNLVVFIWIVNALLPMCC